MSAHPTAEQNLRLHQPLLCLFVAACSTAGADASLSGACEALGLCDAPPPRAVAVIVLCDHSVGAPCSENTLAAQLEILLPAVADRPDSTLDLWMLGGSAARTRRVHHEVAPPFREDATVRALASSRRRFLSEARERLLAAARSQLVARPSRRSPIFEAITKIAMVGSSGSRRARQLVLVTDAREVSGIGDFECARIPTPRGLEAVLRRRRVLLPGSLARVHVTFAFADAGEVSEARCTTDLAREQRIREAWTSALRRSSAGSITFTDGPAQLHPERIEDQ